MARTRYTMFIDPALKASLQEAADAEHRTLANMIEKILIDWLKEQAGDEPDFSRELGYRPEDE